MELQVEILNHQGNNLELKFTVKHSQDKKLQTLKSDTFMCGAAAFQILVQSVYSYSKCESGDGFINGTFMGNVWFYMDGDIIVSAEYRKLLKNDNLAYICKLSSVDMKVENFTFFDHDIWHQIYHHKVASFRTRTNIFTYKFDVHVEIDFLETNSPFSSLYEDIDAFDFILKAKDGSVKVHKVILKAVSPVLLTMLNGDWKESSEGTVEIPTNKAALEAFKEYIYLNKLPDTQSDLEALILLGSLYMMTDLVQKCTVKFLNQINNNNFSYLLEFASGHKLKPLLVAILTMFRVRLINMDEFAGDTLEEVCKSLKIFGI